MKINLSGRGKGKRRKRLEFAATVRSENVERSTRAHRELSFNTHLYFFHFLLQN